MVATLAALPTSDLTALLRAVQAERAAQRSPAELLRQHGEDATVTTRPVDRRGLHEIERRALAAADGFEAVTLAPVSPLGLNAVLGGVPQNNVLSTIRASEVLADPTTALALEAARRRRATRDEVRLCSLDRVLRLQSFAAGFGQHFALFSLVSAGRARPGHAFSVDAFRDHVSCHLALLESLGAEATVLASDTALLHARCADAGVDLDAARADARDGTPDVDALASRGLALPARADTVGDDRPEARRSRLLERRAFPELRRRFPGTRTGFAPARLAGVGYYDGLQLEIRAGGRSLVDGGQTGWTAALLSDRRERLFVSAVGLERLAAF